MSVEQEGQLPGSILYVEDIDANVKVVRAILKSQLPDCQLTAVKTAEEGLQLAIQQQPDLILMDINLPDMDGLEATRKLKQDPQTSHIPVIALTADAMPQQVKSAEDIGFDDYITKPIDMVSFVETLSRIHTKAQAK